MGLVVAAIPLGVAGWRRWQAPPTWTVTVRVDGASIVTRVTGRHPTFQSFLDAAGVQPRTGHLLAAASHAPIPGHDDPSRLRLDGADASPDTPITRTGAEIDVTNPPDRVEPTTTRDGIVVSAPTPGPVEQVLWHRGQPGARTDVNGAFSGELVASTITTPPVPATVVTDKVVALTFDDGPWPDTPDFLAVLANEKVPATFCLIGRQVLVRPEITKQVAAAGMTLCNHTFDHNEHLSAADPSTIDSDLQGGIDAQLTVLGQSPGLYRAPGGDLSAPVETTAATKGEQVIGWSVDPADYRMPPAQTIVDRVMAHVKPGAIILLHDGGGDRSHTLAALPVLIDLLRAAGYGFTTPPRCHDHRPARTRLPALDAIANRDRVGAPAALARSAHARRR